MGLDDAEPPPDRDIAEYCRDVAAQRAVMARDAVPMPTASAFELVHKSASEVLQRKAEPDDAA